MDRQKLTSYFRSLPFVAVAMLVSISTGLGSTVLGGCAGPATGDIARGASGSLTESISSTAVALPTFEGDLWRDVSPSCEGLLAGDETFAVTESDGLVVALSEGTALCVDTMASLGIELETLGEHTGAESLRGTYFANLEGLAVTSDGPTQGEPNPQPSKVGGPTEGEPNPQPSRPVGAPTEGEPNPQPSRPGDAAPTEGEPNPQPSCPHGILTPAMQTSMAEASTLSAVQGG